MCSEDIQHQILACLQQIESSLNSDQYEFSDPFTIGGATGMYAVSSPWNTECEWALVSALGIGTLATTATYFIGSRNSGVRVLANNDSFALNTQGRDSANYVEGYPGALTSQAPFITYEAQWCPLPSPATIYLATSTPATTTLFITVLFRRKLARYIPDKPRQKPHNHATIPHGPLRRMPAESTMVAGYESQYPRPGDKPYRHNVVPSEVQDTAVAKRGIFPLGGSNGRKR